MGQTGEFVGFETFPVGSEIKACINNICVGGGIGRRRRLAAAAACARGRHVARRRRASYVAAA